jgi:hypothetical protein
LEAERKASIRRNNMLELLSRIKLNQHLPWISNCLGLIPFSIAKHVMPAGVLNNIALDQVNTLVFVLEVSTEKFSTLAGG